MQLDKFCAVAGLYTAASGFYKQISTSKPGPMASGHVTELRNRLRPVRECKLYMHVVYVMCITVQ